MDIHRGGSRPSAKGPAEYFTGAVRIDPLFETPQPGRTLGASVTFEPGARTAWHTHPLGQTLIVTAGCGWAQRWGGPVETIRPGDVIWFPPGEKHWHGAAATKTYVQVKRDAEKVIGDKLAKTNQNLETTLKETQIKAAQAEITDHLATAAHERAETGEIGKGDKEADLLKTAFSHLEQAGRDPDKAPMTAEDRITIARNAQPLIADKLNAIKIAVNDPSQQDQLPALWDEYHALSRLATLGGGTVLPPPGPDSPSKLLIGKMQQDDKIQPGTPEAYEYITNSGLKPADQQAALRDSKTPIPWIQATRAADQLIAKTPMSREAALRKVIQQAQARGVTVADRPTGGNVFSPYPNLSSSNITASDAQ